MALKQYKDGQWREIGGVNKLINGEVKPLSALYQYQNAQMLPVWEAGNFRTADGMIFQTADKQILNVTI